MSDPLRRVLIALIPVQVVAEAIDIQAAHTSLLATRADVRGVVASLEAVFEQFGERDLLLAHIVREAAMIRKLAEATGRTCEEVIRQDIAERHPPEDLQIYDALVAMAGG